jgi:regulatory protein
VSRPTLPLPDDVEADGSPGDPQEVARIVVLRMLDRRAYTRSELEKALRKKGVPDEAARQVLDRFSEVRLIDDEALAGGFAVAAHRERGLSGRAVAMKLRQRGVDEATVEAAVGQIDRDSEHATARALAERRLRSLHGLTPEVQARRLVGLLARKGYAPALAYEVVRSVVTAVENAEAEPGLC